MLFLGSLMPEHEIARTAAGANVVKLQPRKPVPIVFYLDGLCMNNGPFRPYHWPAAQVQLLLGLFGVQIVNGKGNSILAISQIRLSFLTPQQMVAGGGEPGGSVK